MPAKQPHRRSGSASARGYGHRWRKARSAYLSRHPLCRYCEARGSTTAATVVDHITPHRGDEALFWDATNWQPLCKQCHDSDKQRQEAGRWAPDVGLDGWPVGG
jgi:5-methylcytosine-specific restriction endonuclease McrA